MAFIPEDDEDSNESGMNVLSEQEGQEDQQVAGAAPVSGGSAPSLGSQSAPVSQAPKIQGTRKQQGSGMFTDISKYIKAGQGSSDRIAGAVTGKMGQQAQDIRKQIDTQKSKFNKGLAQNQANLQGSQQFAQEAVQKAGSGQLQEQDFGRYQSFLTDPGQFNVSQPIDLLNQRARARALEGLASRSGSAEGREDLLKQTFGNRGQKYTRGQRAIDSLLLGADPTKSDLITDTTKEQLSGLGGDISAARRKALEGVSGLRQNISKFTGDLGTAAQDVVGEKGAQTLLGQELDRKAAAELQRMQGVRGGIQDKLAKRLFLSKQDLTDLGVAENLQGTLQGFLTATSGEPTQVDFAQYLDVLDPKRFNRNTVADEQQRARYDALGRLVGRDGLGEGDGTGLKFNAEAAIQDVLSRMGHEGVDVGEHGLRGEFESLDKLSKQLLAINPYMAASLMGLKKLTPAVDNVIGEGTGVSTSDALESGATGVLAAEDAYKNAAEFVTGGFDFDKARGIVDANDQIIRSGGDIVSALNPQFKVTGNQQVDRILTALGSGGATEATKAANQITQEVASAAKAAAAKAASAAASAARAVKRIFCFTEGTLVRMNDGSVKAIETIELGEDIYLGGNVEATGKAYAGDDLYVYKGAYATGSHAIFENGTWLRVAQSEHSTLTSLPEKTVVYPLITENHLMVVNGFICADYQETEGEFDTDEVKLIELNNDADRNNWLKEEELKLQGGN